MGRFTSPDGRDGNPRARGPCHGRRSWRSARRSPAIEEVEVVPPLEPRRPPQPRQPYPVSILSRPSSGRPQRGPPFSIASNLVSQGESPAAAYLGLMLEAGDLGPLLEAGRLVSSRKACSFTPFFRPKDEEAIGGRRECLVAARCVVSRADARGIPNGPAQ
jgi:hypothetical protein